MAKPIGHGESWDVHGAIQRWAASDPWLLLAWLSVLTAEQWAALLTQAALGELRRAVRQQAQSALASYPSDFAAAWLDDVTQDVLLKLKEGTFLVRYDVTRCHPTPYMLGCAFQYARTAARSYWRRYGRDRT